MTLRDGNQKDKRSLVIGDESNTSISLTLWGDVCDKFDLKQGDIVAFQNCRVSDYQGKSLNSSANPQDITLDSTKQKHKRFSELRKWLSTKTDGVESAK